MACVEEVYKIALQDLAQQGNERAQFALDMASKLPQVDLNAVRTNLTNANNSLMDALNYNDVEWTTKTDHSVNDAQRYIMAAMAII